MIKVNSKANKSKWITHPEEKSLEMLIRPLSLYALQKLPDGTGENFTGQDFCDIFVYAVEDWKGIGDENGEKLICNRDNKLGFINQQVELASWAVQESTKLKEEYEIKEEEVKNLPKSPDGETPKSEK